MSARHPAAAVVGTGFIGAVHVEALRRIGVRVAGIVGSTPDRARRRAEEIGVDRVYGGLAEALEDPDVDVVHIASPNEQHPEQTEAALTAGKHVVCEKPLALTSRQTGRLCSVAEESRLVAAVNFNIRFYPQAQEMRARIRSGATGTPYLVTGRYLQDWLLTDTDWNWRLEPDRGGALRVVGDIGSHWFDLAEFVTGQRVTEVMAELPTFLPARQKPVGSVTTFGSAAAGETVTTRIESEDAALILLRFDGGARGSLTASQVSAGHKNGIALEVDGADSALAWQGERPDELWIGHRGRPNEILLRDPSLLSPEAAALASVPAGHAEGFENTFAAMYRAVYRDVEAGGPSAEPDYATFADGHREALILEAVAASAGSGTWTRIEEES